MLFWDIYVGILNIKIKPVPGGDWLKPAFVLLPSYEVSDPVVDIHFAEVPEVVRPQEPLPRVLHPDYVHIGPREEVAVGATVAVESCAKVQRGARGPGSYLQVLRQVPIKKTTKL